MPVKVPTEVPTVESMKAKQAKAVKKTRHEARLFMVRLEADADEFSTHDIFIDAEQAEETRRAAFVVQMKARVHAGSYHPNMMLVAERMLADARPMMSM